MATVTGFEGLRHPRKNDLTQFSELFQPLFAASSDEARRQAAAALSQCRHVPQSVALAIGNAPISIAAIFLTRSTSIDDQTLLQILRAQGPAHATAIARRDNLSVHLVDALVERRQTTAAPATKPAASPSPAAPTPSASLPEPMARTPVTPQPATSATPAGDKGATQQREEELRGELKRLVRASPPAMSAMSVQAAVVAPLAPLNEALLVRFARSGEANLFAATLAEALNSSVELGERILLDISGRQLATALTALGMAPADSLFVLSRFYPHLAERQGGATRAHALLAELTPQESTARIAAWLAAERKDADASHQPYLAPARAPDPRQSSSRQDVGRQEMGRPEMGGQDKSRQDIGRGKAEMGKARRFFSRGN